jgi:phenylalanyl-tRNA synthetase beta chain
MLMLSIPCVVDTSSKDGYFIGEINEPTFFNGRAAAIYLRQEAKTQRIGEFGVLHPTCLSNFELRYPVSTLELDLEVFL